MAIFVLLRRLLLPLAVILAAFAVGGAVFTAANTIPASSAGEGQSTVSGYTITLIAYTLNGADPRNVDAVTFTATADNGSVIAVLPNIKARFVNPAGTWYTCTRTGGVAPVHTISCTTTAPQLLVNPINVFNIVITE